MPIFMNTIFDNSGNVNEIIDFSVICILVIICFTCLSIFLKKKKFIIPFGVMGVLIVVGTALRMYLVVYALIAAFLLYTLMLANRNILDSRMLLGKKTSRKKEKKTKPFEIEKLYDHDNLYDTIDRTVAYLSKNKIGALMTFERKDRLKETLKNGTYLNAPVTFELLITIFYPGTRLHDGAVVIKGDTIVSASVYYKPTTTPLTGKYGSRHRAALGISEMSDSVTVVVSEETGRISIAYNGELTGYSIDNFPAAFENIMDETDISND